MKLSITYDEASGRADLHWRKGISVTFGARSEFTMPVSALERAADRLHPKLFDALASIDTLSIPIVKRQAFAALLRRLVGESVTGFDCGSAAFEFAVALLENANGPRDPEITSARDVVLSAIRFIDAQYRWAIGERDVARHIERHDDDLAGLMIHYTGQTVGQWITRRRIAEAAKLLGETELEINAIASRVGYENGVHFARQFERVVGVLPVIWRAMARQVVESGKHSREDVRESGNSDVSPLFRILDVSGGSIDGMIAACRLACDVTSTYRIDAASRNERGLWTHRASCDDNAPLVKTTPGDGDWGLRLMTLGMPYAKSAFESSDASFRRLMSELGATSVYAAPVFERGSCVGCIAVLDGPDGVFSDYERSLVDLASSILSLSLN